MQRGVAGGGERESRAGWACGVVVMDLSRFGVARSGRGAFTGRGDESRM